MTWQPIDMTDVDDLIKRLRKPIAAWEAEPPPICSEAADALQRMKDALEIYANPDNWDEEGACIVGRIRAPEWSEHDFDLYGGERDNGEAARRALRGEAESNPQQ